MNNIEVKINRKNREVKPSKIFIGMGGENLQENVIFSFEDEFVQGQARLDTTLDIEGEEPYIPLVQVGETYQLPIKSYLTKFSGCNVQLVITEGTDENEIPKFKSCQIEFMVGESINSKVEIPEEQKDIVDVINAKLNQMDTLNLDATKSGKVTSVIITRKDGTQKIVTLEDGMGLEQLEIINGDLVITYDR